MNWFITGTDTDCGKTLISQGLMVLAARNGYSVAGMKPIAAGAEKVGQEWQNADALALQRLCSEPQPYGLINPVCYPDPVAPHLQAPPGQTAESLFAPILMAYSSLTRESQVSIVEGVGGWAVPLTGDASISDLCNALRLPVILVVGLRLGCINHALLTVQGITRSGARLAGWFANQVDPDMLSVEDNIRSIKERVKAPLLGTVPYLRQPTPDEISRHLRFPDQENREIRDGK